VSADQNRPSPAHLAVAEDMVRTIQSTRLRAGARLPSQTELAERYGVSRHVIRKAMDLLEQRGVLGGRQGSGTYVRGKLVDYQITARTRYNDNVRKLDEASSFELLELQVRRASIEMARALAMPRQSRVFDLYILRWTGRDPLCLARHDFSAERFPDLAEHLPAATGIGDLLRRMGTPDFRRSSSTISARQPTRAEAQLLQVPHDSPVIVLEGRNVDLSGIPVELSTSVWPSARIKVHV
jgi:GntR family phosphonate transport system transcriptional regulator